MKHRKEWYIDLDGDMCQTVALVAEGLPSMQKQEAFYLGHRIIHEELGIGTVVRVYQHPELMPFVAVEFDHGCRKVVSTMAVREAAVALASRMY